MNDFPPVIEASLLPPEVLRAARLAPVPAHLRELFGRLPECLSLEVRLGGEPGDWPLAARQLIKLALLSDQLRLVAVDRRAEPGVVLAVSRRGRRWIPSDEELSQELGCLAQGLLAALLSPAEAGVLLGDFAFLSSHLGTLAAITRHMLRSTNEDQALHVLLSGITSGYSLGFNRAALFVWDEEAGHFAGSKAIGPADEAEAHRIWEAIELEDRGIEQLIRDYDRRHFDTRFQQRVCEVRLKPEPGDEVWDALGSDRPLLVRRSSPLNPGLPGLDVGDEYVLAALRPHGRLLGLILADNRHSRAPVSANQLAHLSFFIDQTALVWENLALLRRVEELARVDGLTGTLNRREVEARLGQELARCRRHGRPCSLLLIDLDGFKQVNDTRGHEAGDEVLRSVGRLLLQAVRADDVAGRFGGDEFVIVLPEADPDQVLACAGRVGELAARHGVSLSIGGATWPADCAEPSALLGCADRLLYEAKRAGRGCACLPGRAPVRFPPPVGSSPGDAP